MRNIHFAKLKQRLKNGLVAALFVTAQVGAVTVPFLHATPAKAASGCVSDTAGANDEPGQKDLTKLCVNDAALPASEQVIWNWDELGTPGNNSMDACGLFDTDGDSKVNYSICITTSNAPATLSTVTIYSCGDAKVDRCTSPVTALPGPYATSCTVNQQATDPFPAGAASPTDTVATCTFVLADIGQSNATLTDVCSYPSKEPNSDPSDCVIIQDNPVALVELVKDLNPNDDPGRFNLTVDGPGNNDTSTVTNQGDGGTTGIIGLNPGNSPQGSTATVSEAAFTGTNLTDYTATISCVKRGTATVVSATGTAPSWQIPIKNGDNIVCTITNTRQMGSIKVVKDVVNDNGGTKTYADFTFNLNGSNYTFNATTSPDGERTVSLPTGTYSVTEPEANTMGYATTYSNCASISVVAGQTQTCTITNNDVSPTLTLVKTVTNNNGGTADQSDFQGKIDGNNVAWSTAIPVNAGEHTASESAILPGGAGYTASNWGGDCAANGSVTLSLGQNLTCTITNDDNAPSLTLNKIISNTHGGTATESNWLLTALGPTTISGQGAAGTNDVVSDGTFSAGTYTLSESGGPSGYAASAWSCTNGVTVNENNQITVANGQSTTCTITNSDIAPVLVVLKQVLNPYGDPLSASAFPLYVDGAGVISGDQNTQFSAGSHTVTETQQPGYEFTSFTGEGCSLIDSVMTAVLTLGQTTTCTITNTAIQPKLVIIKHVINDNGGTKSADDFTMNVTGTNVSDSSFPGDESGTTVTLNEGTYSVDEVADSGYSESLSPECSGSIKVGETKTCTITNNDKPGKLIVNKVVENGDNGDAEADDFSFKLDGSDVNYTFVNDEESTIEGSVTIELNAGTYTATENEAFGYDSNDSDCKNVVVTNGGEATCTITNTAQRKIAICHRTDSNKNPYVKISVPVSAIDGIAGNQAGQADHFGEHTGPVWFPGIDGEWGDIIPPLAEIHDGLNWDTYGQATYENNCNPPAQIIVTKYNDLNRNGMQDENEPTLPGWDMTLGCQNLELERFLEVALDQSCVPKTQTTGEDGTTTFVNVKVGPYYTLNETIPEDSNWNLSNIDCGEEQGGLDGDTYYFDSIGLGETIHCSVGNYQDTGTITVIKKLTPSTDQGKFNLIINGKTYAANVGDGGTTGAIELVTGDFTVSETAGTNTSLGDYESSYNCVTVGGGTVTSGTGTTLALSLAKDQNIVCTFTNNKGEILGATAPLVNTGNNILVTSLVSLGFITAVAGLGLVTRRRTTTQ